MELKIINKKEEPLLSRTKVEAEMVFEKATPSREETKSKLCNILGKDEKLIVVKGIYNEFGLKKAKNLSYVYENEESLKKLEVETKKKTGKKETQEGAEEKPQPQEKEEPKQEAKQEEKPKAEAKQEGKKSEERKEIKEKSK
jgi:ribosomal protein S24E